VQVAVRCPNSKSCTVQQLRKVIHFAGKNAMDIDSMGIKVAEQLMNKGFVKKPSDIYRLTKEDLFQLEGFKDRAVERLLHSIESSKEVTLERRDQPKVLERAKNDADDFLRRLREGLI